MQKPDKKGARNMTEKKKCGIMAIDFDGTLCEDAFPGIGQPNWPLILYLKEKQREGSKLILWTCRCGEYLDKAVEWCKEQGLIFDAVNENVPDIIAKYGDGGPKVFADLYIDDRSIHPLTLRMINDYRMKDNRFI